MEYIAAIRRDEDKWQDLNDFAQEIILRKEEIGEEIEGMIQKPTTSWKEL